MFSKNVMTVKDSAKSLSNILYQYADRLNYVRVGKDLFNYIAKEGLPNVMVDQKSSRQIIAYTFPKVELLLDEDKSATNHYEMVFKDQMVDAESKKAKEALLYVPYLQGTRVVIEENGQKLKRRLSGFVGQFGEVVTYINFDKAYAVKVESTGDTIVVPQRNVREVHFVLKREDSLRYVYKNGLHETKPLSDGEMMDEEGIKEILLNNPTLRSINIISSYRIVQE